MSIKRNTAYNLLGSVAPMLVGVITVPAYLRLIGDARYGVLSIVWLFLGYFGLFDPGITRAALFHIARLTLPEEDKERESVFWTAMLVNIGFGLAGGIILYAAARPFFMSTFKMPAEMRDEVMSSLPWLAASIPVSIATGILGGALQARERFGVFNTIYVFNAFLTQLVPLGVAFWHGPDLKWLIPSVLIARTLGAIPQLVALVPALPLGTGGRFKRSMLKPLFSYGGWVTITNLVNPILTSMDRMLIGSVLSAQAVAFYTIPFNLVSRVSVLPGSLVSSLFPKLSSSSRESGTRLAEEAVTALCAVMTPIIVIGIASLPIFMRFWVGQNVADHAAPIGVILLVGIWINGLAYIPAAHLQAINRPDLPAKFHAIEVIPFLGVLWFGVHFFGLAGAAWAWTARVTIDAILLFVVAGQTPGWRRVLPGGLFIMLATVFTPTIFLSLKTVAELVLLIVASVWSWRISPLIRVEIESRLGIRTVRGTV